MTTTEIKCRWCHSANYRRVGIRKLVNRRKQILYCKDCKRKFDVPVNPQLKDNPVKGLRKTYSQNWSAYNASQTQEKTVFLQLLSELCARFEWPEQETGRPKTLLSDLLFSVCVKSYDTFSSRRLTSELNLCQRQELIESVPHFNTVLHSQQSEKLTPCLRELVRLSALPLAEVESHFSVDSTGFSTSIFGRWFDKRFGKDKTQRVWLKAHALTGAKTNIIIRVKITDTSGADSKQFVELVKSGNDDFDLREISADKAYSGRENIRTVVELGAQPYIPFRNNTTGRQKGCNAWSTAYRFFVGNQPAFYDHYHQRSNVEATFSMMKRKFSAYLRAKTFSGQVNEILAKCVCHNLCVLNHEMNELDINPWKAWGSEEVKSIAEGLFKVKNEQTTDLSSAQITLALHKNPSE